MAVSILSCVASAKKGGEFMAFKKSAKKYKGVRRER
jgi:hypothetical protein